MSEPDADHYSPRERVLWLTAALALLASVVLGVALFGGGGGEAPVPAGEESLTGVLIRVEPDRLRLRLDEPRDGEAEIEFTVEGRDRGTLDLPHLELHAADGLRTVIIYERDGDRYIARRAEDAP